MFTNATKERPALYLTTLSEPLDKVLRYGESLTFFDQAALKDGRVIYQDVGPNLGEDGLTELTAAIDRALKEFRPGLVVIDSLRSLQAIASDRPRYRKFLYDLLRRLTAIATTSIWNAPYSRAEVLDQPEAAIADAIVALDVKQIAERETRVVQVLKLRGSGYRSGEHMYRLTSSGLEAFPRMAEARVTAGYDLIASTTGTGRPPGPGSRARVNMGISPTSRSSTSAAMTSASAGASAALVDPRLPAASRKAFPVSRRRGG